ncbi:hypothetical protein IMY97_22655 [Pectobacterium versatile]|uniref:hypothetical protein n=1 Tax=Pectobacterium versatile TaxID=2488639 RepID=UPI001FA81938|nr:hypothetical protein [Pectobacterium versatile]UNE80053.1 hypothetical protein IMY97_22655 [Pectobacterium versatile]
MKEVLESLLIASVAEMKGDADEAVLDIFPQVMKLIISQKELFEEVPEKIYISSAELRDIEKKSFSRLGIHRDVTTGMGASVKDIKNFFEHKAVMLKDHLHASAFGRMSYIYRSKGERLYLFENSTILILLPYAYIDHDGFQLDNEVTFFDYHIEGISDIEELQNLFDFVFQDRPPHSKKTLHMW